MSYSHIFDLAVEATRSGDANARDMTTRKLLDAAQAQLDLIRARAAAAGTLDRAGHYDADFRWSDTSPEDVWILRAVDAPGVIHRGAGTRMKAENHDLRAPDVGAAGLRDQDVIPGTFARGNWRYDPNAILVGPERLHEHLIVADLHDEAGQPVGVIDLRGWADDLDRAEAQTFLDDPHADHVRESIVSHAWNMDDPNLRKDAAGDRLSVTFRDLALVVDIVCTRHGLTSDIGLDPAP